MSIIGEPFAPYVDTQIKVRQELMGEISNRGPEMLAWANAKTAWVKLASGVFLEGEEAEKRLKAIGLNVNAHIGTNLAQKYILFGGTSERTKNTDGSFSLQQRSKFNEVYDPTDTDFGLVPMPGIESVSIQDKNRGSIKEATIEIIANSRKQLEILDILYLRLGYTVLIEWGNSHYIDNNKEYQEMGTTHIERFFSFFEEEGSKRHPKSHRDFLTAIENLREEYSGNYDGFMAKVVNFNWTFQSDGTYKITLKLISLGDVVESFKMNLSATKPYDEEKEIPPKNHIEEKLNLWVLLNTIGDKSSPITIEYLDGQKMFRDVGWFITPNATLELIEGKIIGNGIDIVAGENRTWKNTTVSPISQYVVNDDVDDLYESKREIVDKNRPLWELLVQNGVVEYQEGLLYSGVRYPLSNSSILNTTPEDEESLKNFRESKISSLGKWVDGDVYYKIYIRPGNINLSSGLSNTQNDIFYLNNKVEGEESVNSRKGNLESYFVRMGYLLGTINEMLNQYPLSPSISTTNIYGKRMPNQMSFDPRVCIVRNGIFYDKLNNTKYLHNYKQLEFFQKTYSASEDGGEIGDFSNCYLSFSTVKDSIDSNTDERGDLSLLKFLEDICGKINRVMGGINNLEPIIDEKRNQIQIVDSSLHNKKIDLPQTPFQIFGYNGNESTFVRNVNLKTEISPEFASMVTIGSTAAGYSKGMESTAFSKWNRGIFDRFKENETLSSTTQTTPEPEENYLKYLLDLPNPMNYLGMDRPEDGSSHSINPEIIETNLSVSTEFFKYLRAKTYEKAPENYTSTSNGFIPFNLQLTMDGLSGMKIYNKIEVDTRFLPSNYPENLKFVIKRVSHKISNGDWETSLDTTVMPGSYSV